MNPRKPIDLTGPDAEFEALLRRRIHELADHAPTAVRVVDEVAVRRAVTAKRGRSLLAVAATVAVMAGAGALAVFVVSDGDTAGAASPDAAVTELAAALRSEDLLEVIAVIDPAEVPAIQAGIDEGRRGAEQEGAISDELLLERLQGIDSAFSDQAFDTEELAPDLAVVTPLGGSASTTSDPADVHIATVKRDGRWFVSLQYSIAESIRRRSGSPFPTDPPVVPVGAAGPEAAAEAFYRHLLDGDAAGLATTFAPGEGDALLRYASLWVPALQDRFDEARLPGDEQTLSGVELQVDRSGDRATVRVTAFVLEGTIDRGHHSTDGGAEPAPSGAVPVPVRLEWRNGCLTVTGADAADVLSIASDAETEQVATDVWRQCRPNRPASLLGIAAGTLPPSAFMALPSLAVAEIDGSWYVSPLGTVADEIIDAVDPATDGGTLFDTPLGSILYGVDRSTLEDGAIGLPLDETVPACRDLFAADTAGIVVGVLERPDPGALRACAEALTDNGRPPSPPDGGNPTVTTPTTVTSTTEATVDPVVSAPVTSAPVTSLSVVTVPPPVTSAPVTSAPRTTVPSPVTSVPRTTVPSPVTSVPRTTVPSPVTSVPPPVTSAPVTSTPVTSPPITPAPVPTPAPFATAPPVSS
jgi:hypothetical protein